MKFSERKGFKSVSEIIQKDRMSDDLRNSLWNILDLFIWNRKNFLFSSYGDGEIENYSINLWFEYFKKPVDTRKKHPPNILAEIREYFFTCEWYEIFDFLEFSLRYFDDQKVNDQVNRILERELSAYRLIGNCNIFTDITDEQEIEMLESAFEDEDYPTVAIHLNRALELLSDRENPDYRNSIKESISAVESISRLITGESKATLGEALKILEKSNFIHPSLKEGFLKLYGYTSDEDGIRHAMMDEPKLSAADAKYFLLSCTSFINYLKSKV